jgi:hypothetical protein
MFPEETEGDAKESEPSIPELWEGTTKACGPPK